MKHIIKYNLFSVSILITVLQMTNVFAATVDSTKPIPPDTSTSAKMAPKVPMVNTVPLAPGVRPFVHKRANQTDTTDESIIEDECKKPRNPGDPEKDEKCYQRNTK